MLKLYLHKRLTHTMKYVLCHQKLSFVCCQLWTWVKVQNIKLGFTNLFNLVSLDSGADV